MAVVRIRIANGWTASEFAALLGDVQFLADVAGFSEAKLDGQTPMDFFTRRRHRRTAYYDFFGDVRDELRDNLYLRRSDVQEFLRRYSPNRVGELHVRRLELASPGLADLAGFGKIVEQVRIFLTDIIDRFLHKEDRAIARGMAAQEVLAKKLKNAEQLAKLIDKVSVDPQMQQMLMAEILGADQFIEGKVLSGQITGIETIEE
jgi:hypothetical protein